MRAHTLSALLTCGLVWGLAGGDGPLWAQDAPKGAAAGPLTVMDHAGKEFKLQSWKFLVGTRRLSWLATAPAKSVKEADEPPAGPEALEFREEKSTTFKDGILTLVPLASIKKIEYDAEMKTVKVTYLKTGAKGPEEEVLGGTTRYVGINKLVLEAETDLGELGKAALKFQAGNPKGLQSIVFPAPKAVPAPAGRPAAVTARDKNNTTHSVLDLQPLYLVGKGKSRPIGTLLFEATVKIDLGKLQKLRYVPPETKSELVLDFEVTLKDGKQHTLTLRQKTNPADGKPAVLQGLVGRVAAGYRLFPPHTIAEVQFDEGQPVPKKE